MSKWMRRWALSVLVALGFLVLVVAGVTDDIPAAIAGLGVLIAGIGTLILYRLRDILYAIRTGADDIETVLKQRFH